jgi:orotidine-5'-phosphate decarboxylase
MAVRDFKELVSAKWDEKKFLCVGLDSEFEKLPEHLRLLGVREAMVSFNIAIVEATKDFAAAYKPNSAFYEAHGEDGWAALYATCEAIRSIAPDVPIILDAKRGDIGNTNEGYAKAAFDLLGADAITVQPYMGEEALSPFLARKDKGVIVLCRTSNGGSAEFQNLEVNGEHLYTYVARQVSEKWNKNGNCALVAGATYLQELAEIRAIARDIPILIPGVGAQNGDLEKAVQAGLTSDKRGIWINASRSIIFASSGQKILPKRQRRKQKNFMAQFKRRCRIP